MIVHKNKEDMNGPEVAEFKQLVHHCLTKGDQYEKKAVLMRLVDGVMNLTESDEFETAESKELDAKMIAFQTTMVEKQMEVTNRLNDRNLGSNYRRAYLNAPAPKLVETIKKNRGKKPQSKVPSAKKSVAKHNPIDAPKKVAILKKVITKTI